LIRIVMLGRLGNNLFQYALGRVLAEKHGVPLVLDASWFNAEGWGQVSHFLKLPIQAKVIRPSTLGARALRKFTGKHFWEFRGVPVLREAIEDQSFNPLFLDAPGDCMLFGYFQSPRYFDSMAPSLRAELNLLFANTVRVPQDLRARLMESGSVAVHVRRGDYLKHPAFHVCDSAYYQKSVEQMRAHLRAARFFVFSDEPEWCRSEFTGGDMEVIDSGNSASNPLHDLHLMSLASHHIIANSSYSWWAAWLGDKPGQEVIMPDRWYAHSVKAPIEEKQWQVARF
jgi:hypothetical protein